jgi:hypothetical protein
MVSLPVGPVRPFVGREAQLAVAEFHLDGLARSSGSLLVLVGEPGIGKTRLAEEVVGLARERGARTVWATAWRGDGAPPLWPWVQILRQLTGSAAGLDHPQPESPTASSAARFAQFESIVQQLLAAAAAEPLVVVIDDLHWADTGSIRLLTFVAAAIRDARCMLFATYRPDELAGGDRAELARVGTTLAVPPLPAGEAATLLRLAVGADVSLDAVAAIAARSGGNPLFVWEFGQLMAQSGRRDVAPAAIPGAVTAVIERRLARLSEEAVAVLRVAAVVGDPFSATSVSAVAGIAADDVDVGLAAAAAAGLVTVTTVQTGFCFSHDLLREVVLENVDPATRRELHHRAANVIGSRARTDPSFHAAVADHLAQAGVRHAVAASAHWELAGRWALSLLAYEEAATFFARSAQTCLDDPGRQGDLLVAEGEALLLAGDLDAARARFEAAVAAARSIESPELLARAVLGIGTGPIAWEVPIADNRYATLITDALARLPEDSSRLRSMLLARLSVAAATPQTVDVARRRAEAALELAERVGEPALIGQALAALNDAIAGPAHTITRRDNADAIVELAREAGDRALELLGYRFLVVADLEVGDIAAVDRDIAAFTRLADVLRQPLMSWYVPLFHGMRALLAGNLDAAERCQGEVADAAAATGSQNAHLLAATLLLGIDVARARRPAPDLLDAPVLGIDPGHWAGYAAGMAMVKWRAGEHERARDLLMLHAGNHFARLGDDGEHLTTLLMFGRVAAALGERAAAQEIYDLLAPHTGLWAVDGIAACCWGPVDLELGRLAIVLDDDAAARVHLGRARRSVEQAGAVLLAAEVARMHAVVGDRDAPAQQVMGASDTDVFRRDGQFWTLTYQGHTVRLKDAKGLHDLARLLGQAGREFHVLDLAGSPVAAGADDEHRTVSGSDLGELLDARARAEYRRRLAELDDELDDAERSHDPARVDKARAEREFLANELAAALGIGGRPRRAGDPAERARKAVTGRIRMTISRIAHEHPTLARHLGKAVRTGTYCAYEPESAVFWQM